MTDSKPHIALAGGGLSGRLCALLLRRRGYRLTLFERGGADGAAAAAYVAAAMLAPSAEALDSDADVIRWGRESLSLWQALLPTLPQPVWIQQNGTVVLWHGQDRPLAEQFVRHLDRVHGGRVWQDWTVAELAANEAALAGRFAAACFLPEEGQLDGRQLLDALAAALDAEGVCCRWHHEAELAALDGFDWRIDCRGIGARTDWNSETGSRLRGVRGEVARVYAPEVSLNRPVRLLHPRYPLYIAPKENHVFVVGATQLESENPAGVSVRSSLELMSALYTVHPAFGEAEILELRAGLRPTLNHHNPEIRFCRKRKIIALNGLFRHGFMIAPVLCASLVSLAERLFSGSPVPPCDPQYGVAWLDITAE